MVSARALLLMFAASVACKVFGDFGDSSHCVNGGGCPADHACTCKAENHGCVPLAQLGTIDEGCLIGQGGSTTGVGTSGEPTGTGVGPSSTTGTTAVEETSTGTSSSGETTGVASSTGSSGVTTGEPECDPAVSVLDDSCDPSTPYCIGINHCGTCGQLADIMTSCAEVEPGKPVCSETSGRCVECTTDDTSACPIQMPGCDEETGTCGPCTEHSQCPTTACDMKLGTCFPEDSVVWIENTANKCTNGDGTELKPFCTLQAALPSLVPGKPTTIKFRAGQNSVMLPLTLKNEGYVLAIVRGTAGIPVLDGTMNATATIEVSPNSRVYLSHLRLFRSGASSILACEGGELYVDDSHIVGLDTLPSIGLAADNCAVKLRRTRILKTRGGLQMASGSLWMENSHVTENGAADSAFGAFRFLGDVDATITYSSVALHPVTMSTSTFTCLNQNSITVRNSAVVGPSPSGIFTCDSLIIEGGLVAADENPLSWFEGPLEGVLRPNVVEDAGILKNQAMWVDGDPRYDYDREPRPTVGPSWAGADEPL